MSILSTLSTLSTLPSDSPRKHFYEHIDYIDKVIKVLKVLKVLKGFKMSTFVFKGITRVPLKRNVMDIKTINTLIISLIRSGDLGGRRLVKRPRKNKAKRVPK